jgi:NAD(P)H dehydrogenase (quinone)
LRAIKKVFVVLAHPEHQSFDGAMFRTAVETLAARGHEIQTSDLHAVQFDPARHGAM